MGRLPKMGTMQTRDVVNEGKLAFPSCRAALAPIHEYCMRALPHLNLVWLFAQYLEMDVDRAKTRLLLHF